jgi:L-lactate dehydrogenase complex protein LldG
MSARDEILSALRAQSLAPAPLPALEGSWIAYPDLAEQFELALGRAAGSLVRASRDGLGAALAALPAVQQGRRRCSLVPELAGNQDPPGEPQAFRDLDVLIVPAEFGVAESGAVWLGERVAPVRAGLFLTQHLVLVLARQNLVQHLHQAYERLGAAVGRTGYGCFLCGPSKTADIEQALVVGAHGPRSLAIVLYE